MTLADEGSGSRDALQKELESKDRQVSPVMTIPPEILGEIFWNCLPDREYVEPAPNQPPLCLAEICQRFRAVALSTPQLWSSICITLTDFSVISNRLSLITTWLDRSGTRPLSFAIETRDYHHMHHGMENGVNYILSSFLPCSYRWRSVHLPLACCCGRPCLTTISLQEDDFRRGLPLLQRLSFYGDPDDQECLFDFLSCAPNLGRMSWKNCNPLYMFGIPWARLSELDIELNGWEYLNLLEVLYRSPGLKYCNANAVLFPKTFPRSSTPLVHRLTSLFIVNAPGLDQFLDAIELPDLDDLSIRFIHDSELRRKPDGPVESWPHHQFMSLLSRSYCQLQELKLDRAVMSPKDFIELLQHPSISQSLVTLQLIGRSDILTDTVVSAFKRRPSEPSKFLPELTHLTLKSCISSSDGLLADMIESRAITSIYDVRQLQRVVVGIPEVDHEDDLLRLQALRDTKFLKGISVHVFQETIPPTLLDIGEGSSDEGAEA